MVMGKPMILKILSRQFISLSNRCLNLLKEAGNEKYRN